MQATPKYVIPDHIGSLGTRSFMLVCLCVVFPMTPNGDPAVGVIQGDVFMSWGIHNTNISLAGVVLNPNGSTVIFFSPLSAKFTVTTAFRNRVKDNGSSISLGRISFQLLNLTLADAGKYYYKEIQADVGGQVLVIAGNPANISVMEVSDPLEDEKYTMRCSAQSTGVPLDMGLTMYYQWKRENGQNITVSDRYSFSSDQSHLTINPLKRQDAGTFVCEAWEHVGAVSKSDPFSLKVIYGPDSNGTTLSPSNISYQLTESSSFTVQCTAICVPQCNYQWMGPSISQNDNQGLLHVSEISRNQSGTFTCNVTNPENPGKSVTANLSVIVYYGPDDRNVSLSPSNTSYQLTELSHLDVNCSATCEPQCNYQWSGPGLVSQNDNMGWLSISQIQRNQNGTFICTVTNPKVPGKSATANLSVIVYYGPDSNGTFLSPSNTSYQLTELSPLEVQCSATCFPQCIYQWMGPGISQNDSNGLLFVSKISRNQAGTFACTVTNPRMTGKSVTANFSLIVYYPPVLTMKASNTSKGGRMVINCTASGVPDNYTFYKWTHMAPDTSRTVVRDLELTRISNSEVSLTIEGATYQDTGFYVCKASNGIAYNSKGQLVMEDVYIWITDQPVITSNTRDFYAEKGKSGQMFIEFYLGLSQPLVAWYLDKNRTMELLQNSSNICMHLSTVTVELQYHQKTVHLPGYNASLEVFSVDQDHFTSYKVEINNSFAQPKVETLELKPRGPPETPANLSVVPDSVTTHSLQLTWRAGFHGGDSQTFVIEYREAGKMIWLTKEEPRGQIQYITLNATITDLKDGTRYEFRIYSKNIYNRSQISSVINETTKIVIKDERVNPNGPSVIIGAATGSALVLVIAVAIVGFNFYKRRQSIKSSEEDVDVLQDEKSLSDRHKSGLVDNPVYDSSGPFPDPSTSGSATGVEYAAVVKRKKKGDQVEDLSNLYAQVDKTKNGKKKGQVKQTPRKAQRGDIYENATLAGRDNLKGNMYENSGQLKFDEDIYENPSVKVPKGSLAKKDGLLYADMALDSPTTKNGKYVIRGLENRTEYAEIAYDKRGEPLPDNEKET